MAFWAHAELSKRGELFPLYLIPIAIRHVYLQDMSQEIDPSLERLERELLRNRRLKTVLHADSISW